MNFACLQFRIGETLHLPWLEPNQDTCGEVSFLAILSACSF